MIHTRANTIGELLQQLTRIVGASATKRSKKRDLHGYYQTSK
jgi:hypothetical protein